MIWRVLYVDDEEDLREVAQMSLELDPAFKVRCSASGAAAIEELREWRPDLVLMDVMMPELDGLATLARMRSLGDDTPVVFVTARAAHNDVEQFKAIGAEGVIAKPFDPLRLTAQVRDYLSSDTAN